VDDRTGFFSLLTQAMGAADVWLLVAYVVSMFAVAAFRPQQIGSPVLFRLSFIVFAAAVIVPCLIDGLVLLLSIDSTTRPPQPQGRSVLSVVSPLFHLVGRALYAAGVVLGLASLSIGPPRREVTKVKPVEREGG
jgi:hypothetical protein